MKVTEFEIAEECVRLGNLPQAVRALKRALRKGMNPLLCYARLAELHRLQSRWNQAIAAARQAVRLAPDPVPYREMLVEILMESGQLEDALQESLEWWEENPEDLTAMENLARAYWQRSEFPSALRVLNRLIKINPLCSEYRLQRAEVLQQLGLFFDSADDFETVMNSDASIELRFMAQSEVAMLDRWQMELIVTMLMENPLFRVQFSRDRRWAVEERGFRLSEAGKDLLEMVNLRSLPLPPCQQGYVQPN